MIQQRSRWRRFLFNVFAWTVVSLIAFPLLWMILTSLKPQSELFLIPPSFLPGEVTFEHYRRLLVETPFLTYMKNSAILAVGTTVVVIVIATLGAHSLVRFSYPGRERMARLVLFTYLLPSVVLIIPLYFLMISIGLGNTLTSLIIAYTTFALPYALWLLRSFMAAIPDDLEAAAMVDGATRPASFRQPCSRRSWPGTNICTRSSSSTVMRYGR
jgi:multiple sugar transport system permease protein